MNSKQSNVERAFRSTFFVALKFKMKIAPRILRLFMVLVACTLHANTGLAWSYQENEATVDVLKTDDELKADETISQEQISQWIKELSHDSFLIRDSAKSKLKGAGEKAFSQLYRARKIDDLESRLTIQELLAHIKVVWVWETDSKEVEGLMLDFQFRSDRDRAGVVDRLSWLATSESWSALFRIMIYDRSERICDRAAARLMEMLFLRDKAFDSEIVEKYLNLARVYGIELKQGEKLGQQFCDAAFEAIRSSQGLGLKNTFLVKAINALGEIVERSKQDYPKSKKLSDSLFLQLRLIYSITNVVADARKFKRLGEVDEKLLALLQVETAEQTIDDDSLMHLVEILIEHQRWEAAKKLFSTVDLKNHGLLVGFMKAHVYRLAGDKESAKRIDTEQVARIKTGIEPYNLFNDLVYRRINRSALFVLESKIGFDRAPGDFHVSAAEIHFDLRDFEKCKTHAQLGLQKSESSINNMRAFSVLAEVAKAENDPQTEISWLKKILAVDPLSVNTLVRLNSLKAVDGLDKKWLASKISIAAGAYRDQVRLGKQMSQSSTPAEEMLGQVKLASGANKLAWLLVNLEENLDEAREMAAVAVQLEPRNPNYLDSLALCEFKQGNREKAISLQKRAVYMAPNYLAPNETGMKDRLDKYEGRN